MKDINKPKIVEILIGKDINGWTNVWINTEEGCQFRAEQVGEVILSDQRLREVSDAI